MKKADVDILKYLGKVILITLLIVFVLRCFFFEFYTISTSQMESALIKGDELLVDKTAYGPRMPITPLSIPFAFDRFLSVKSYSSLISLPYKRLFAAPVKHNDVVLFNNPIEIEKPLDKRSLLISRCIAVPGDTILIRDGLYYINNQQYVHSPTKKEEYATMYTTYDKLETIADSLYLDFKHTRDTEDTIYFSMSRYDGLVLGMNAEQGSFRRLSNKLSQDVLFIVPSRNRGVYLSPNNINLYQQIIEQEQGMKTEIVNDKLFLNDKEIDIYTFQDDYYWMLSDNSVEALDSRILGFIPFENIIGKANIIMYSYGKKGFKADRFFEYVP